jgi:hypothetical protein
LVAVAAKRVHDRVDCVVDLLGAVRFLIRFHTVATVLAPDQPMTVAIALAAVFKAGRLPPCLLVVSRERLSLTGADVGSMPWI